MTSRSTRSYASSVTAPLLARGLPTVGCLSGIVGTAAAHGTPASPSTGPAARETGRTDAPPLSRQRRHAAAGAHLVTRSTLHHAAVSCVCRTLQVLRSRPP